MELINPIPAREPKDKEFFDKDGKDYKLIYNYGCSAEEHFTWLQMMQDIGRLSPSILAIKNDFKKYVFDGGIYLSEKSIPGFVSMAGDAEEDQKKILLSDEQSFIEKINSWGLHFTHFQRAGKCLEENWIDSGNRYLRVQLINTSGVWRVNLIPVSYMHGAYWEKKSGDKAFPFLIAKSWDKNEWGKNVSKPIVLPTTRYTIDTDEIHWKEIKKGTTVIYETLIHSFDTLCSGDYYDASPMDGCIDEAMAEIMYGILTAKIASSESVTKMLLAFEASERDPKSNIVKSTKKRGKGFQRLMKGLQIFGTNNAGSRDKSTSIFGIEVPFGKKAPTKIEVPGNRDHDYQKYADTRSASCMYSIYGWSRILTGRTEAPGGIGADRIINELIARSITIDCKRKWYGDFFTWLLNGIHTKITNEPSTEALNFVDTIQPVVNRMKEARTRQNDLR